LSSRLRTTFGCYSGLGSLQVIRQVLDTYTYTSDDKRCQQDFSGVFVHHISGSQ
jgi:hypothetical protein